MERGDLSSAEIERVYQMALADLRRGGTGDVARRLTPPARPPLRSVDVLRLIEMQAQTIHTLARHLDRTDWQVWGHVSALRKQRKVDVKYWLTSAKGRKVAVYGVTV